MTDSSGSNITSPSRRHLEYQASFSTSLIQYSPVLHDVTANYASGAGLSADSVYNYPNPFSPLEGPTTLRFDLETPAAVEIKIYDLLGRPKWSLSLAQGAVLPGVNEIPWRGVDSSGNELPNGAYLMTVEASGIKITKKIAILR